MSDPYHYPAEHGLELILDEDDPDACYSFDIFAVWRHTDSGDLYYATDSGCSCPSPFEDYTGIADLTRYTDWPTFTAAVDGWLYGDSQAVKMARHEITMAVGKVLDNA